MVQYYNINFLVATCFGLGKIPKIPGTIGAVAAFPIMFYCIKLVGLIKEFFYPQVETMSFTIISLLISIIILFTIGTYCAGQYAKLINQEDPKEIVIDEIVGQMLTITLTTPFAFMFLYNYLPLYSILIVSILTGFFLFRMFDIIKPWPINWLDKNIKGGIGIMLDDILAAIFAIVLHNASLMIVTSYFVS